jgi:hypothetical protein
VAFTESLNTFLADFGVSVSFTGSTAGMLGIEDAPGVLGLVTDQFPGIQQTERTVLVRTDQKGALAPDASITVNGTARVVIDILPFEDGAFSLVRLR